MSDLHVTQFTGSRCAGYNCAAASCALAIQYARGPLLTADQVRAESGVSCVPGVDTLSGGLRIEDVKRVAAAHGVAIDYGRPTNWDRDVLRQRLVAGYGAIVLGDCQDAPVNPTAGVVYHSAFVHSLDANGRTHWHDPRLSVAYWITLADVIRYWESFEGGVRYAGFVARDQAGQPPDTSTGDEMPGPDVINFQAASGAVDVKPGVAAGFIRSSGAIVPAPASRYGVFGSAYMRSPVTGDVWVTRSAPDDALGYVLKREFTYTAPAPTTASQSYNAGLDTAGAAVAALPRR